MGRAQQGPSSWCRRELADEGRGQLLQGREAKEGYEGGDVGLQCMWLLRGERKREVRVTAHLLAWFQRVQSGIVV
jgi:hypothetical protein